MLYSIKIQDRVFHTLANSQVEAIKKVIHLIRDERLSPMTYKKLKELGLSFSAYLTFLIVSDVKNEGDNK